MKTASIYPTLRQMWKKTAIGNQMRLIVNGEASEPITITRRAAHDKSISPLTFAVVNGKLPKWLSKECQEYLIAGIDIKGMDYMGDEVHIAVTGEDIRTMVAIQSVFAEWAGMNSGSTNVHTGNVNS